MRFVYLVLIFYTNCLIAQKEDYNWLIGYRGTNSGSNPLISVCKMNFKNENLKITRDSALIYYNQSNSIISDRIGERILLTTNGFQLYNSILNKLFPDCYINIGSLSWSEVGGDVLKQGCILLLTPGSLTEYRCLYLWMGEPKIDSFVQTNRFYEAKIDLNKNGGLGEIISKDELIMAAPFEYGKITSCRHANGRDWWIILPKRYSRDMYVFLFDPMGIRLHHTQTFNTITHTGVGMAVFSPDGNHYAIANTDGYDPICQGFVEVYDFDRCLGNLSNKRELFTLDSSCMRGLAFSPNSQFLYYNTMGVLYRLDINQPDLSSSKIIIDNIDGTLDPFLCAFGASLLGPDHKIYIASEGGNRCMSVINYPDQTEVKLIGFDQNGIRLPSYNFKSIPNLPNFRLGPVDESSCDSLDIDNIPLARFRFESDTTDYLKFQFVDLSNYNPTSWYWDFGDPNNPTSSSSERNPNHRFSGNGVYTVCLTIKNNKGSNTQCKSLTIGISKDDDLSILAANIELFPNPFEENFIVNVQDYYPSKLKLKLYNIHGYAILEQAIQNGVNSIKSANLKPGYYMYEIIEKSIVLKRGTCIRL